MSVAKFIALLNWMHYTLIAFDERVTLTSTRSVTALCVCVCCMVCVCDCVMVIREPTHKKMQHTHMHKAMTRRVEAKKLLSHRRQSNYRSYMYCTFWLSGGGMAVWLHVYCIFTLDEHLQLWWKWSACNRVYS